MRKKKNIRNIKGMTLVELFVVLGIISLMVTATVPGFKSFFSRAEVANGVRSITSALNSARFESIKMNKSVKISLEGKRILFMEKRNNRWQEYRSMEVEKNVSISMNASPVFSPFGTVSPLCSTYIENDKYLYKISISMAGRIKVAQLR